MEGDKYLWVAVAIVMFVIGIEYLFARSRGKVIFRFQNTISNFSMGAFDRVAGMFLVPLIYLYYEFLYDNFGLFFIPETLGWFVFAILVSDFIWYFYHKSGHRINFFWGAHIIHHQSEDYNYSVALNLTPFQVIVRVLFWSLMPVFGFSVKMVLGTHLVIGLYQFLLHTTLIPKLGIIEKIFVTPSHHRVHHGSNPEYLDKNFGGVLIIWDRMFGTFQEEINEVSYGITKDVNSREFLTTVFHYYQNLIYQMRQLPSVKDKFLLLVKGPDWVPDSGPIEPLPLYIDKGSYAYKEYSVFRKIYIIFNTMVLFSILIYFGYHLTTFNFLQMLMFSSVVLLTLVIIGRMLEDLKTWILELLRVLIVSAYFVMNLL